MQDLSFKLNNPVFEFGGYRFEIQLFTFTNVFGMDIEKVLINNHQDTFNLECSGLTWAGGQEKAEGSISLHVSLSNQKILFKISAKHTENIRCVKLLLHDVEYGTIINLREAKELEVPPKGIALKYPEGWCIMSTPMIITKNKDGKLMYFRSKDKEVRQKKFVLFKRDQKMDIELIFEEDALKMGTSLTVPEWEVGNCASVEEIYKEHAQFIERNYNLEPWETRRDVPEWAREISLVVSIHGQHWTGHIFNDYKKILESIKWIADRIDGKHVLVYIPGWEGRYYYDYGAYKPDPRMGGEEGFRKLVEVAKGMGVKIMPMFGINAANRTSLNFEQWGEPSRFLSPGGLTREGSCDWDGSRHYDHGTILQLNPGAPGWQNKLVSEIRRLVLEYGFEGVFLDLAAQINNDAKYNVYNGVLKMIERIRENNPQLLISGEGWFDAMSTATPLVQSGANDEAMHWHDVPYEELFTKYNRAFGHLCMGDPGKGSVGVHEYAYHPIRRTPLRKGIIPTVTIVEDTLKNASAKVEEIISDAKTYARLYL